MPRQGDVKPTGGWHRHLPVGGTGFHPSAPPDYPESAYVARRHCELCAGSDLLQADWAFIDSGGRILKTVQIPSSGCGHLSWHTIDFASETRL